MRLRVLAFSLLALMFVACGGGGGGGGSLPAAPAGGGNTVPTAAPSTTPAPKPTLTPSPVPTATATVTPTATPSAAITQSNGYMTQTSATVAQGIVPGTHSTAAVVATSQDEEVGGPNTPLGTAALNIAVGSAPTAQSARRPASFTPLARWHADLPVHALASESPAQANLDRIMREVLPRIPRTGTLRSAPRRAMALPTTLGSTANIWVSVSAIGSSSTSFTQVPSTLVATTAHGRIWLDNTLTSVTSSDITNIANDFENAYSSDTTHFGTPYYPSSVATATTTPCDASGTPLTGQSTPIFVAPDSQINVVVLNTQALGSGVGGYFTQLNYLTQAAANCAYSSFGSQPMSNESAMIVVGWNTSNPAFFETGEDLVRGTAHEFQHLINFVNHYFLAGTPQFEDKAWNEGLSMLSQDFAVSRMYPSLSIDAADALGLATDFLNHPDHFSLTAFTGLEPGASATQYNCAGCYGDEYLFQRYLYDRFGGDAYTHAMEQNGTVSYANLQQATGGQNPQTLISDYSIALLASNQNLTTDPRFAFTVFNPYGTYTDQFGQSYTLNGPNGYTIPNGNTSTLTAYKGSFTYFGISGLTSGGELVTLTDQSGTFQLKGGIVSR